MTSPGIPSQERLREFVGRNADYYLPQWQDDGAHTRFNIAAFFLGPLWMLYRRMYLVAATFIGIVALETVVSQWVAMSMGFAETPTWYDRAMTFLYAAVNGALGNRIYYWHAKRKLARLSPDASATAAGGTSLVAAAIPLVLAALVLLVVALTHARP